MAAVQRLLYLLSSEMEELIVMVFDAILWAWRQSYRPGVTGPIQVLKAAVEGRSWDVDRADEMVGNLGVWP